MSEPYYADDRVTLYHGDCRDVLAGMADRSVDCVITDPPYSDRTHRNAKANSATKGYAVKSITFASISDDDLREAIEEMGRVSRGWLVSTLDYRHAVAFDVAPPEGLRVLRLGVWVKTNPTPQISGDRPSQGWESIAYMHRDDLKPSWGGGGKHGNFVTPIPPPEGHPTAKPLPMVRQWVQWFTKPGDVIFDDGTERREWGHEMRVLFGTRLRQGSLCARGIRSASPASWLGAARGRSRGTR